MSADIFMTLVMFAFVTSITPGPNNLMLLASGVNFGFRRTIPHMMGIGTGFFLLLLGVGYGLGALLEAAPVLYLALKFAGGAYMLYLAYKIATATSVGQANNTTSVGKADNTSARPMSFMQAVLFQWVNPKAWVMAVTAMASYTSHEAYTWSVLVIGVVFALINLPSVSSWAAFGSLLRQWLENPVYLKWFNLTMALLLVLSLWPMLK
ncbi:LysE family translocator [Pseudochrobactrum sp. MP213Fo]|uniref:LysE family translocator n=1 Tax=Pseudochrobactrum sp. MP213Fo TaxID=3022250 RepID=UPI003BA2D66D